MTDLCALPVYCPVCHVRHNCMSRDKHLGPLIRTDKLHPTDGSGHPQLAFSWIARADVDLWTVSQYSTAASYFLWRTSYSRGSYHIRGMIALRRFSYTKTPNS